METAANVEELSDVDPAPIASKYMVKCKIKFENLDATLHELREKISIQSSKIHELENTLQFKSTDKCLS